MTSIEPSAPASLLVVDDEPELRSLLGEYFGRHAYTVRCAADAAQARTMIADSAPHLAILDVNMPGENGLSLARWLREAHPGTAIVMLTTAGESVDRIVGLELGADDYVPKPFEMRELLARVRAVLRRAETTAAAAAAPLTTYFARFGCTLESAVRPSEGLAKLRAGTYDAAILDVMLPEMDGFELCREIRKESDIPIVMLTARGEVMDRVVGLELGADDYVPKPFEPRELVARVQTILRRQRSAAPQAVANGTQHRVFDGLAIDLDRRQVLRHGERVELTGTEFELLALLAAEPGKVFSRDDILNRLRGHEAELYTRAVDIVVSRLRKKLEPLDCIKTLRNAGYALAVARSEPA